MNRLNRISTSGMTDRVRRVGMSAFVARSFAEILPERYPIAM